MQNFAGLCRVNIHWVMLITRQLSWHHVTWYTAISLVWSATNIFCVSLLDAIQFGLDLCSTSWATQTALADAVSAELEVPLHVPPLKFQRTILQSLPPDTSMSSGWNLGKWTWDVLEVCFLRQWSGINFFLPSNLKSWILPSPKWETKKSWW